MDEINQIQNPNVTQEMPPTSGPMQSSNSIPPSMSPMTSKKKGYLFWVVVAVILAVGGVAWWYVKNMSVEAPAVGQPQINKEAREDTKISNDVQGVDLGNIDNEFMEVDKDLNSL